MDKLNGYDNFDIELDLDFDYSVGEVHIDTIAEFKEKILLPYLDPETNLYYRGERIGQLSRPLLPTLLRKKGEYMSEDKYYKHLDADWLLEYYRSHEKYFNLYNNIMGKAEKGNLYDICAFSQHYVNASPFIDLTKSLYVALSFGLKGKTSFTDDPILYVIDASDRNSFTKDRDTAEKWLSEYSVDMYNTSAEPAEGDKPIYYSAPHPKVIDIPTNDLMKFQRGAFLLLTDFPLRNQLYLTKNVRDSINITKFWLNKDICPTLTEQIHSIAPWYDFNNLIDIRGSFNDIF